jgi:hypothetical protein
MTFARYYAEILRRNETSAPTVSEAIEDYKRALDVSRTALEFSTI